MEDIQVIPSCHDGGMISLIQSHALLLVIFAYLNLKAKLACHCTVRYKMEWIYTQTKMSGQGSLESALEMRKKERKKKENFARAYYVNS